MVAIVFAACKKINEPTELGGGLIPPIDNITTFETFLPIETDNRLLTDTNRVYFDDDIALGHIASDPEFGATHANGYFNISAPTYGTYPFVSKDSVTNIDSVILSLSYEGGYGDTANTFQTLRVFEIAQSSDFNDTTGYRYSHPDFPVAGGELGSKTFQISKLKDSVLFYRKLGDTTKYANVIRIPLSNSFGQRLINYDTSSSAISGAYRNDTSFKKLFKGFAIKADNSGNALTYFSPSDNVKTKLIVYFRTKRGTGFKDTLSTEFYHQTGGQANSIIRTPAGGYLTYLNTPGTDDDKVYLPTAPGSYALLNIPGLTNFANAIIHRAEIIITPLPSAGENIFWQPAGLFLDRINAAGDTAMTFDTDMSLANNGSFFSYDATQFGGLLKSNKTYGFNISRYIQNMITMHNPNYKMRLYAPVRAFVYSPIIKVTNQIYVNARAAYGRVVLAGGSYADPAKRMRLRIVYSKI